MNAYFLPIKFGTSRGTDTYGYTLVTLRGTDGKAFRTCGGGYDMIGTVLGDWMQHTYQQRLMDIRALAGGVYTKADGYKTHRTPDDRGPDRRYLYGMTYYPESKTPHVSLDGACGKSEMIGIGAKIGLLIESSGCTDRRGRWQFNGYHVMDFGSEDALRAAKVAA